MSICMLALSFLSNCIVSTFVTMHGSVIVNFMHKIDVELNLLIAESKVFAIFDPIAFFILFHRSIESTKLISYALNIIFFHMTLAND